MLQLHSCCPSVCPFVYLKKRARILLDHSYHLIEEEYLTLCPECAYGSGNLPCVVRIDNHANMSLACHCGCKVSNQTNHVLDQKFKNKRTRYTLVHPSLTICDSI